jgi:hypothetical protein
MSKKYVVVLKGSLNVGECRLGGRAQNSAVMTEEEAIERMTFKQFGGLGVDKYDVYELVPRTVVTQGWSIV